MCERLPFERSASYDAPGYMHAGNTHLERTPTGARRLVYDGSSRAVILPRYTVDTQPIQQELKEIALGE